MKKRGKMKYVPAPILDKLFSIKDNEGLKKDCQAWERINRLTEIGSNVDDFYSQLFGIGRKGKR